jgi:hypothetical protein
MRHKIRRGRPPAARGYAMLKACSWPTVLMLAILGLTAPLAAAEEAWRADGRHLRGSLLLDQGRLRFTPTEGEAVPLTDLTRIRFAGGTPAPFRAGGGRRVLLRDGERITGQVLRLDGNTVTMRTAWAARIELPRADVTSIEPLPGWRIVADDEFQDGLKAFTTTGEPALTEAEPRALLLRAAGQSVTYTPPQLFEAGRAGVNFQERGEASGARWTFELHFGKGEQARRVAVTVAGNGEHYAVDAGGRAGTARSVARTPGWHRLLVQFTKRSLRVTCDDEVLWYNLERGPGDPLTQVTMRCHAADGETARGTVAWTAYCLERAVNEHPKPPVEDDQDEVRLADDDQLFGRILRADRRAIEIEGRFGKRSLPWTRVAGCTFRLPAAIKPNEGANVRLLLDSGLDAEADVLEGVVTALDERRLTLRHALVGEVTLERARVRELRPLAAGAK